MEPDGIFEGADQGRGSPAEDWNGGTAELSGVEGVLRCLLDGDVAGNDSDGEHAYFRRAERHDERNRVIGCSVRIDKDLSRLVGVHSI